MTAGRSKQLANRKLAFLSNRHLCLTSYARGDSILAGRFWRGFPGCPADRFLPSTVHVFDKRAGAGDRQRGEQEIRMMSFIKIRRGVARGQLRGVPRARSALETSRRLPLRNSSSTNVGSTKRPICLFASCLLLPAVIASQDPPPTTKRNQPTSPIQ